MNLSTKDEIIKRFLKQTMNRSRVNNWQMNLGISRTAIWKHLQNLQEDGYNLLRIKKKGYN